MYWTDIFEISEKNNYLLVLNNANDTIFYFNDFFGGGTNS